MALARFRPPASSLDRRKRALRKSRRLAGVLVRAKRGVFGPEDLVRMRAAYEAAIAALTSAGLPFESEELARAVVRLAMAGEFDAVRLADGARSVFCAAVADVVV